MVLYKFEYLSYFNGRSLNYDLCHWSSWLNCIQFDPSYFDRLTFQRKTNQFETT